MPKISGEVDGGGIQAVTLTLRILERLAASAEACGVSQLAQSLGVPRMRVYRHLRTLVEQGYAQQDAASERYQRGPQLVLLGRAATSSGADVLARARPWMDNLQQQLGQTVIFGQVDGLQVRVMDAVVGTSEFAIVSRAGTMLPMHYTALGKVALAFSDEPYVQRVVRAGLKRATDKTITTAEALRKELARVRRQGWAQNADEGVLGFNAVAAPVFAGDILCGCVGVIGSTRFLPARPPQEVVSAVLATAAEITKGLAPAENP